MGLSSEHRVMFPKVFCPESGSVFPLLQGRKTSSGNTHACSEITPMEFSGTYFVGKKTAGQPRDEIR